MPRPNLIGASNRYTNSTCVFGSMAGLAPTATVRSDITRIHGYKYARTAANGIDWNTGTTLERDDNALKNGCGLNKSCADGMKCIKAIGYTHNVVQFRTGGGQKLLA